MRDCARIEHASIVLSRDADDSPVVTIGAVITCVCNAKIYYIGTGERPICEECRREYLDVLAGSIYGGSGELYCWKFVVE